MAYLVGIVGERSYQARVKKCRAGMTAEVVHERGNPFDSMALRVDAGGGTVGYIPKDHWLRDVVHKEGKPISAAIHDIGSNDGNYGIVLTVDVGAGSLVRAVAYARQRQAAKPSTPREIAAVPKANKGLLAGLLKGLFK